MAGIYIDALPPVATPAMSDVFPMDQASTTYQVSNTQMLSLYQANASGIWGIDISGNAASATTSTTTTTATNANNLLVTQVATNASFFPLFVSTSTTGNKAVDLGTGLTFNPSTNTLTTTTFVGALTGNATSATTATTATNATNSVNIGITDDNATNATMYPLWVTAATGNLPAKVSSTKMTFNPSTGVLTPVSIAPSAQASALNMNSHLINNVTDPVSAQDAATKNYVDTAAGGFTPIPGVIAGSTAALTVTYNNGVAGVGATLTNAGVMAAFSLDGVSPTVGQRVLIKDQASSLQNGLYSVTTVGSGAINWVLTRTTDYNQPSEINPGDIIFIETGTVNQGSTYYETATVTAIGVDAISFSPFFTPATYLQKANNLSDVQSATTSRTNLGLGTIATQNANNVAITGGAIDATIIGGATPAAGTFTTLVGTTTQGGNILLTSADIQHVADTDNKIAFGTDTQDFQTGGSSRLDISNTGVRMGGANSRVTTILDEDNMASDSATALATQQSIKAYVDNNLANTYVSEGRLTLTSATPVTTADVLAATTLYFALYKGNQIALYDGSANWDVVTFTELSIAVPATTNTMYDVWVYNNSGTATLELLAWTSDTARNTALTTQNGIYVKTGATTRRYVGSIRTTGSSGQTEDSAKKRYVWNYYNRVERAMTNTPETAASWTYSTAAYVQANSNTANQLDCVVGVSEDSVNAIVFNKVISSGATGRNVSTGVGINSTTVNSASIFTNQSVSSAAGAMPIHAKYDGVLPAGRNTLVWLVYGGGADTQTWVGQGATSTAQCGITGSLLG